MQQIGHHVEVRISLIRLILRMNYISTGQAQVSQQKALYVRLTLDKLTDRALSLQFRGEVLKDRFPVSLIGHASHEHPQPIHLEGK